MTEPRAWAERIERHPMLPDANAKRFAGYGVMGLPFASGHILALRRFPSSSVGPGFTTIWHRSPEGIWAFYSDVPPSRSCPRYFSGGTARTVLTPIHLTWLGDRVLTVQIADNPSLDWQITLDSTPTTRLLNAMGGFIPESVWLRRRFFALMGRIAGPMLRVGRVRLHGHTPNHQWFLAYPLLIWTVPSSQASFGGRDLGPPTPLERQARLADFWIPQRGLFMVGRAYFEPFDAALHLAPAGQADLETNVRSRLSGEPSFANSARNRAEQAG